MPRWCGFPGREKFFMQFLTGREAGKAYRKAPHRETSLRDGFTQDRPQAGYADHPLRKINDLHRLPHIEKEELPPRAIAPA